MAATSLEPSSTDQLPVFVNKIFILNKNRDIYESLKIGRLVNIIIGKMSYYSG